MIKNCGIRKAALRQLEAQRESIITGKAAHWRPIQGHRAAEQTGPGVVKS